VTIRPALAVLHADVRARRVVAHDGAVSDIDWDERYAAEERIWSGEPNGALVAEVADLTPGRVLDVGCGEGADAVWLARRGWDVTALDVSAVAVERARAHAAAAGVSVTFHVGGLEGTAFPPFDLVSAQYPALRTTPEHVAERALLDAVAPGGVLLVVHHVPDAEKAREHGFELSDYVSPVDVRALLDDTWDISFEEGRPRTISGGSGAHHTPDVVLRARRRA
jgi:SAM-dependent methyltransferase